VRGKDVEIWGVDGSVEKHDSRLTDSILAAEKAGLRIYAKPSISDWDVKFTHEAWEVD
jgi:hypothetical protein